MNSKPKRVLHVVGGMNVGGAETMIMNLYRNINREKLQFDFLVYYEFEGVYDKEIKELGGKIIKLSSPRKAGMYKTIKSIASVINEYGPYIAVHAHNLLNCGISMKAAKKAGVSVRISHSHSTQFHSPLLRPTIINKLTRNLYSVTMKCFIIRYSTWLAACGKDAAKYLYGERKAKNSIVIKNGIDINKFAYYNKNEAQNIRDEFKISDNTLVIGCIGRLEKVKNHSFMIDIIKYMSECGIDVKLIIVGEGSLKSILVNKISDLDLKENIVFAGLRQDIPQLIQVFHVLLMPSLYEGLPVTLLEAQAAGIPCVISDGITQEVDLGLGLIKYVSLKDDLKSWFETVMVSKSIIKPSKEQRVKVVKEMGYDVKENVKELYKLYGIRG